jgi:AraC family transcriptional regulator
MDDLAPLAIEGLMLEMIACLSRGRLQRPERRPPAWLERARDLLRQEFAESHTLSAIAAAVGVHPTHLAREFRRLYGVTVGDYTRGLRIAFACRRLADSDAPLFEIAADAGFADHSHFARSFKAQTGVTPGEYRRASRSR